MRKKPSGQRVWTRGCSCFICSPHLLRGDPGSWLSTLCWHVLSAPAADWQPACEVQRDGDITENMLKAQIDYKIRKQLHWSNSLTAGFLPLVSLAAALWKQFLLFLLWFDSSFTASTLCLDLAHNKRTSFLSHPEVITINFISMSFVILLSFAGWWWVVILVHSFLSWVCAAQRNAGAE